MPTPTDPPRRFSRHFRFGRLASALIALLTAGVLGLAGVAAFIWFGAYDVSATGPHFQPVHSLLEVALKRAVQQRADAHPPPADLLTPERIRQGAACFRDRCVACHGAPGVAPEAFALGLQPVPGSLIEGTRHWRHQDLYWITRNGIKMSGMPAWEYRLDEGELWALVAFLDTLPRLTPDEYRAMTASISTVGTTAAAPSGGRPVDAAASGGSAMPSGISSVDLSVTPSTTGSAGKSAATTTPPTASAAFVVTPATTGAVARCDGIAEAPAPLTPPLATAELASRAFRQHGCTACHAIPGVVGPETAVGPPLAGLAARDRIAGKVAATEPDLAAWIRDPQSIDAHTAMPTVGISETQARLMARYLLAH